MNTFINIKNKGQPVLFTTSNIDNKATLNHIFSTTLVTHIVSHLVGALV